MAISNRLPAGIAELLAGVVGDADTRAGGGDMGELAPGEQWLLTGGAIVRRDNRVIG